MVRAGVRGMVAVLDHLVVTTPTLEMGVERVESTLGVSMDGGGDHVAMGTHNRLLSMGPEDYVEVIAVNPLASSPGRPRFFDLDTPRVAPRLTNWVLRVDDLPAALARAPEGVGEGLALARGPYSWCMAVPADGKLPFDGLFPSLICWQSPHPAPAIPEAGVRLLELVLSHPDADTLAAALAGLGFADERVRIETGAPGLAARLSTPSGEKTLA